MEENNGRTVNTVNENPTMEELQAENTQLKQYLNNAVNEIQQLRQAWLWKRMEFLFDMVKCNEFNAESKVKAVEEIENFLYPNPKELKENNNGN